MTFNGHIVEVSDNGETVTARLQGECVGMADWRNLLVITIQLPTSPTVQRTYHLGRKVQVKVSPR